MIYMYIYKYMIVKVTLTSARCDTDIYVCVWGGVGVWGCQKNIILLELNDVYI